MVPQPMSQHVRIIPWTWPFVLLSSPAFPSPVVAASLSLVIAAFPLMSPPPFFPLSSCASPSFVIAALPSRHRLPFLSLYHSVPNSFVGPTTLEKTLGTVHIKDADNDKSMLNPVELTYAANANEFSPSRSRIANYPPPINQAGGSPSAQRCRGLNSPGVFRKSALRDSNWRQRGSSFVVPSPEADPFYSGGKLDRARAS